MISITNIHMAVNQGIISATPLNSHNVEWTRLSVLNVFRIFSTTTTSLMWCLMSMFSQHSPSCMFDPGLMGDPWYCIPGIVYAFYGLFITRGHTTPYLDPNPDMRDSSNTMSMLWVQGHGLWPLIIVIVRCGERC